MLICPGKSTVGATTKKRAPTRPPTESANSSTHQFLSYWSILEFEIDIWFWSTEIYNWNMCHCARSHFKDTSWIRMLSLVIFVFFSVKAHSAIPLFFVSVGVRFSRRFKPTFDWWACSLSSVSLSRGTSSLTTGDCFFWKSTWNSEMYQASDLGLTRWKWKSSSPFGKRAKIQQWQVCRVSFLKWCMTWTACFDFTC